MRHASPTLKYQFFERQGRQYHAHDLRRWACIKLHAKNVKVGTCTNRNARQDQVTVGRGDNPASTHQYCLSFVNIQHHAPVIAPQLNLAKSLLWEAATACRSVCWLANNCQKRGVTSKGIYPVLHQLKHVPGIKDEQQRTQHTSLRHARNDWDPLTNSAINHDSLPAVGEELPTNGQHTAGYTNRLQFE